MSDEIRLSGFMVTVQYRQLSCVGCRQIFAPGRGEASEYPRELHLVKADAIPGSTNYQIAELLADPEAWLAAADRAGWRKITLYGQTMYVCDQCRKTRARPEWERRLV